jgi:hypothetical protein
MKLSDYKGKVVVLLFWRSEEGSTEQLTEMAQRMRERFAGKPFEIVGVNRDPLIALRQLQASGQIAWPNFSDPEGTLTAAYRVSSWPLAYVLDGERKIHYFGPMGSFVELTAAAVVQGKCGAVDRWVGGSVGRWVGGSVGRWVGRPVLFCAVALLWRAYRPSRLKIGAPSERFAGNQFAGKPAFEGGVVVEVVLPGAEAELTARFDIGGEVVDVAGFGGLETVDLDRVVIDLRFGLDRAGFEGKDGFREVAEDPVVLEDPRAMDAVGVGEQDQPVTAGGEGFDDPPHRLDRGEDVPPGVEEVFVRDRAAEAFDGPRDVFIDRDPAGFEVVLFL